MLGIWLERSSPLKPEKGKVILTALINASPRDLVFWEALKKSFEADNPDIKLNFVRGVQEEKKLTMVAGGVAPDVIDVGVDQLGYWLRAEALVDLTDWIKADSAEFHPEDIYPVTLQPLTYQGHIYALPFGAVPFIMFYNKDLFQKYDVPYPDTNWTWQDLRRYAKKMTRDLDGDGVIDDFGLAMNLWTDGLYTFIYQNGGHILSDDSTRLDMADPKTIEAIQFIYDMLHRDRVCQTAFNRSKTGTSSGFKEGRVAMLSPGGVFWIPEFRFWKNLDWDIAPLPKGPAGRATTIAAGGYGVSTQSKHPYEAYKFVKYIASVKGQQLLARSGLFVPCRRSVCKSDAFLHPRDPETGERYKYPSHMENAIKDLDEGYAKLPAFTSTRWPDVAVVINERFGDLLYNPARPGVTPASVCQDVTVQGNRILQEAEEELKGDPVPWRIVFFVIVLIIIAGMYTIIHASRKKTRSSGIAKSDNAWGYALISPWLIGFIIFTAGPILFSIFLSFCRWLALGPPDTARFVGLENFKTMFTTDPKFAKSLLVTSYYTVLSVPLGLIAGIALALLMNIKLKGIRVFRTIYFLPAVLPSVAVTVLWSNMFKKNGILNYILLKAYNLSIGLITGPLTFKSMPDWLLDANFTIPALVIIALWGVGGGMMIYLAGLQGISPELYEAAELDGAGRWKKFWRITLPQLSPVIFFNLIMSIIGSFQVFTQAYILFGIEGGLNMQAGGPEDSALFYVLRLYLKAFKEFQMGYASGLAWVLFIIILIFTLLVFKSSPMWVYYEGQKEGKAI